MNGFARDLLNGVLTGIAWAVPLAVFGGCLLLVGILTRGLLKLLPPPQWMLPVRGRWQQYLVLGLVLGGTIAWTLWAAHLF